MLVELGPQVQASHPHTGSWVCYCLGWKKAQETVRLADLCLCPHSGHVCAHMMGRQMEQESRGVGKAAAVKGPLLLGPSALGLFPLYL